MAVFGFQGLPGFGASSGASANPSAVTGAIRDAAKSTGASFDYLLTTARVESGLNPQASAKTSSARGLFQFIDRTWLSTVKQAGPALGYGQYADAISQNSDGSLSVADPAMRQKILELRDDPKASAAMAAAFTSSNATQLTQSLGRKPNDGELYMAHFMGANGASQLISAATGSASNVSAASLFPKAAEANHSIFYNRDGSTRSTSEVYSTLMNRYEAARNGNATAVAALQTAQTAAPQPVPAPVNATQSITSADAIAAVNAAQSRPLFYNMFSSGQRGNAAVSSLVTDLWQSRPSVAAALTGGSAPAPAVAPATQPITTAALTPVTGVTPVNATSGNSFGGIADRLLDLYRDLPANVRSLFTART